MRQLKIWGKLVLASVLFGGGLTIGLFNTADADGPSSSNPGMSDDPVVTKGYVDQKVAELVQAELAKLPQNGGGGDAKMAPLEVVEVAQGQKLTVNAGGELIVRIGKAIAFSADASGLPDMTDGLDVKPGKVVGNNHLILFPRDGRGVSPDPKTKGGLTVLVRGGYTLK